MKYAKGERLRWARGTTPGQGAAKVGPAPRGGVGPSWPISASPFGLVHLLIK